MIATSHLITGALIGKNVKKPLALVLLLALSSHLVLDILPHYGPDDTTARGFIVVLSLDILLYIIIISKLVFTRPKKLKAILLAGLVATVPDLLWIPYWLKDLSGVSYDFDPLSGFLSSIQWAEKPVFILVDIVWITAFSWLLFSSTKSNMPKESLRA